MDGDEQVLLRLEVIVERAGQDAGRGADLLQRGALVAFFADDPRRSGDEMLASCRGVGTGLLLSRRLTRMRCSSARCDSESSAVLAVLALAQINRW